MTVAELIGLLKDLPKDTEVGKVVNYIGIKDEIKQEFTPFVSLNYVVEVKRIK